MLTSSQLHEMSQADIETIDPATLVNASAISINSALVQVEKVEQFIAQAGNPYCFLSGNTPVKIRFVRPERDLAQLLGNYLSRK